MSIVGCSHSYEYAHADVAVDSVQLFASILGWISARDDNKGIFDDSNVPTNPQDNLDAFVDGNEDNESAQEEGHRPRLLELHDLNEHCTTGTHEFPMRQLLDQKYDFAMVFADLPGVNIDCCRCRALRHPSSLLRTHIPRRLFFALCVLLPILLSLFVLHSYPLDQARESSIKTV